jgi:hypothetical protein
MTTKNTKREYCTGCRRWIATWKRNSWGTNSWGNPTMRPAFGKYCEHGRWFRCAGSLTPKLHIGRPASRRRLRLPASVSSDKETNGGREARAPPVTTPGGAPTFLWKPS